MSISTKKPICSAGSTCGFGIAYYLMDGIFELQPVLFDNRGRQFYVTAAPDDVVYREIPVGRMYDASGYEPLLALPSIVEQMPIRLKHFIDFIESQS